MLVKMGILPKDRGEKLKKMKPPASYFLLDSTVNFKQRDRAVSWNKRSPSKGGGQTSFRMMLVVSDG